MELRYCQKLVPGNGAKNLTGPQVHDYVGFSIKSVVSTETNLTSTKVRCYCVYLRRDENILEFMRNKIVFN
jgi:hypothetical protein